MADIIIVLTSALHLLDNDIIEQLGAIHLNYVNYLTTV